jgi:catechol 2,3-dioxygenase-like lactoylglutathione lyase family enzyme
MIKTFHTAALILAGVVSVSGASAAPKASSPLAFNHFMVAISVADLEAETAWYVNNLGFKVAVDTKIGGGTPARWLVNGNERIELIAVAGSQAGPARATPPRHAGIRGFSQVTLETRDIAAVKAALAAKGITPALDITEVKPLGVKVMYLVDPEGNAVEIAQRL